MRLETVFFNEPSSTDIYYYQAFGLTIKSTLPCPELLPQPGKPEVYIRYGAVPDSLDNVYAQTNWYQQNSEAILLKIDPIANYLILQGKQIIIDKLHGSHDDEVRLFLFGSAFGALLHQRGLLPVHGSAIEVCDGAMLFIGPSGCGKSTLAGALHQRGYRIIADDVCVVSTANSTPPLVYPGFPRLKLWPDALEKLGKNAQSLGKITPTMDKRDLPLQTGFCADYRPIHRIYELTAAESQEFGLRRLRGVEKLTTIIGHTYRSEFLAGGERKKGHFLQCVETVLNVEVNRVTRPLQPFQLAGLIDILEEDWKRQVGTENT
jgi:hypothetical protein